MCIHYTQAERAAWLDALLHSGCEQDELPCPHPFPFPFPSDVTPDMWPGQRGAFVRRLPAVDIGYAIPPTFEVAAGRWGLFSTQTRHVKRSSARELSAVNSRDDQVQRSPTFGRAWRRGQHCIVLATAIFEPDYRGPDGEPMAQSREARISRTDDQALGLAGLWDSWTDEDDTQQLSFTVLTVNADDHPLMRHYHRPNTEKRMPAMIPRGLYREWLHVPIERSSNLLQQFPAHRLQSHSPALPIT